MFGAIGQVESAQIVTDRDTGCSNGFAFVQMADETAAENAIAQLNGTEAPDASLLLIKHSRSRKVTSGTAAVVAAADAGIKYVQTIPPPVRLAIPGIR